MRIAGSTQIAGIIGWPVDRSLSPAIHNAGFEAAGLNWVYVAFPVRPDGVGGALEGMRALGIRGLNVTMPHKRAVIAYLDAVTPDAGRIGAVNTIALEGDRLVGSNTDGPGFLRFLEGEAGVPPAGKRVLVLGAGGAARALVVALAGAGAGVQVAARRGEQAEEAAGLVPAATALAWAPGPLSEGMATADLLVNATPVGRVGADLPLDPAAIESRHVVVDLTYAPEATPLLRVARERGARAFNGLGMLLHQAALSFELWTGVPAPMDAMSAAAAAGA